MMERAECKKSYSSRCVQELPSLDYDEHRTTLQLPTLSYKSTMPMYNMVYNVHLVSKHKSWTRMFFQQNLLSINYKGSQL